jgi:GH15 family glucan-1,4-alpha-glucosidase
MNDHDAPIPYSSIKQHELIGDRRTAALVTADGTIDWFCLPRYDGQPVLGALLNAERGGLRDNTFMGNTPLLFSQVEYVRAILETEKHQSAS